MLSDHRSRATAIIGNSLERRLCFVDVGHRTIKPEHGGIGIPYHHGQRPLDLVRHRGRYRI